MSAVPLASETPEARPQEKRGLRIITSRRVAIILFNLGGPDEPKAVRPFLFNLFNDRAIIPYPQPIRFLLAMLIARSRERIARANYELMGGRSPILPETLKQAEALDAAIAKRIDNVSFKCFPAMRYWQPLVKDAAKAAEAWGATDAILLPLYPQYLDHNHRLFAARLEGCLEAAGRDRVLLSRRAKVRAGPCRGDRRDLAQRRFAAEPTRAFLRPWLA